MTKQEANLTQEIEALRREIDKLSQRLVTAESILVLYKGRVEGLESDLLEEQRSRQVLADRVLKLWHDR